MLDETAVYELQQLCTGGGLTQDSLSRLIDAGLSVQSHVRSDAAVMAQAKKEHYQIDTDNSALRNAVEQLTVKLEDRKVLLTNVKAEKKKLLNDNAKLEAALKNANERLETAQELEHIDMGQFNAMQQQSMEMASKIDQSTSQTVGPR